MTTNLLTDRLERCEVCDLLDDSAERLHLYQEGQEHTTVVCDSCLGRAVRLYADSLDEAAHVALLEALRQVRAERRGE